MFWMKFIEIAIPPNSLITRICKSLSPSLLSLSSYSLSLFLLSLSSYSLSLSLPPSLSLHLLSHPPHDLSPACAWGKPSQMGYVFFITTFTCMSLHPPQLITPAAYHLHNLSPPQLITSATYHLRNLSPPQITTPTNCHLHDMPPQHTILCSCSFGCFPFLCHRFPLIPHTFRTPLPYATPCAGIAPKNHVFLVLPHTCSLWCLIIFAAKIYFWPQIDTKAT